MFVGLELISACLTPQLLPSNLAFTVHGGSSRVHRVQSGQNTALLRSASARHPSLGIRRSASGTRPHAASLGLPTSATRVPFSTLSLHRLTSLRPNPLGRR